MKIKVPRDKTGRQTAVLVMVQAGDTPYEERGIALIGLSAVEGQGRIPEHRAAPVLAAGFHPTDLEMQVPHTLLNASIITAKTHDKVSNGPNCQNFSHGVIFNDTEAIGSWHLLHFITEKTKGSGDPHCVEFTHVGEQERNELQERIGKYVENLDWETITLKMQIPCKNVNSTKTRDYYLERLESNGSYRTLQMPSPSAKLDLAEFHRYPMRLKIIEGQYLGMIDCHEKFVFLLGKQPPQGKQVDDKIKRMIETYWPEEL